MAGELTARSNSLLPSFRAPLWLRIALIVLFIVSVLVAYLVIFRDLPASISGLVGLIAGGFGFYQRRLKRQHDQSSGGPDPG